jgi:hypothetical protein
MALGSKLIKKLEKSFPPKTKIEDEFRGNDLSIVTNDLGEAITLFIGQRKENGDIRGEHYVRKIVKDQAGKITKSHWDNKGKVG